MKKFLTTCLLACAALSGTYASKAITTPFQVTLQDGRTVMARFHGDENFSFYTTTSGELLIFENNTWRIATEADKSQMALKQNAMAKRKANEKITATRPFPHTGTPKALVIMVDFANQKFTYTRDDFDKLLNGKGYKVANATNKYQGYGSAAQYFEDCSNGKFRPQFDVVGPFHLQKNYEVYGKGNDDMASFIPDACSIANSTVNFADYDSDGDGYVDLVYIIYAGYSASYGESKNPNAIWPKSGSSNNGKYDGKQVYRYGINNELAFYPDVWKDMGVEEKGFKPYLTGIGIFLHEMSHTMGLPDFYPTVDWSDITKYDNQSLEEWDLMDGGENTYNGFYPTPYSAWERELLGWTDKMDTLKEASNVTLKSMTTGGKGLRVMNDSDPTGNEYYILENIENGTGKGWYEKMPGNGMLVTHVNYDPNLFSNFSNPNNTYGLPRITILPANGTLYSTYHCSQDFGTKYYISSSDIRKSWKGNTYPGSTEVTSLTNWKAYTGTMSKDITNIVQQTNGDITFAFMGGIPVVSFRKSAITTDGTSAVANALNVENPRADGKTTYSSSNNDVATVDNKGNVTGLADGTATITATYTYNDGKDSQTATYKVTIKLPVPVLSFAETEITTDGSSTVKNALTIKNTRTDGKTTYSSSNKAIATVDSKGNVKGIADGTATITATYKYNNSKEKATASYKVTVKLPETTTSINGKTNPDNKADAIYTIDGKYAGTSRDNLKDGIYIQNNKKFRK